MWKIEKFKEHLFSAEKRALIFLISGTVLNLSYAVYEILKSIKYSEFWSGIVAIYYIFLSGIKLLLIKSGKRFFSFSSSPVLKSEGRRIYGFFGILLLSLNVIMGIIILGIIFSDSKIKTQRQIIFNFLYALFRVIIALKDMFYYKNENNYIMSATKIISLSGALVALFSLQNSMLVPLIPKSADIMKINIFSATFLLLSQFSISAYMILHKKDTLS